MVDRPARESILGSLLSDLRAELHVVAMTAARVCSAVLLEIATGQRHCTCCLQPLEDPTE